MTSDDEVNKWKSRDSDPKADEQRILRSGSQEQCASDPLFEAPEPARVRGASVTFEPGARTAWHTHPLGQTLIVTSGLGWAQREGGPIEEIRPGDVVWFAPNERHWHGDNTTKALTHIAIQEALDGKVVDWMEHVTDKEYLSRTQEKQEEELGVSNPLLRRFVAASQFCGLYPKPHFLIPGFLLFPDIFMRPVRVEVNDKMQRGYVYLPHKTDGTRIPTRIHARADAEADARARRVRREIT